MSKNLQTLIRPTTVLRLIDLENLCGGSGRVGGLSHKARKAFDRHEGASIGRNFVAVGRRSVNLAPDLLWHWKDSRVMIGKGKDGADKQLLAVVEQELLKPALELHLWSGDHCFAPAASSAIRSGLKVIVFGRPGSISGRLLDSGADICEIDLSQ